MVRKVAGGGEFDREIVPGFFEFIEAGIFNNLENAFPKAAGVPGGEGARAQGSAQGFLLGIFRERGLRLPLEILRRGCAIGRGGVELRTGLGKSGGGLVEGVRVLLLLLVDFGKFVLKQRDLGRGPRGGQESAEPGITEKG